MKPVILSLIVVLFSFAAQAQLSHDHPYLIVRLVEKRDDAKKTPYWEIAADKGNPRAQSIYQMYPYASKIPVPENITFFNPDKSMIYAENFYNYFTSPTTALNFLAQQGWRLMTITTETSTQAKWTMGDVYTGITTTPVYYFERITIK